METIEIFITHFRCLVNGREFTKAGFGRDLSQEWGQKYYVTEDGEAAIVDLINAEPEGMRDLDQYVKMLWKEFGPKDVLNGLTSVQQAAWRFFADLSHNGCLWYFQRMEGHPVCGLLIRKPLNEEWNGQFYSNAERIGGESIQVELQPVTFTKWLGLSDADKQRWMKYFLATPAYYDIKNLDKPLFPHPFHPELSL